MPELSDFDQYRVDTGSAYIFGMFPWIGTLGMENEVRQWLVDGLEGEALIGALRKTPQYQQMFPWIKRNDGTLRMTEAEYLRTQTTYRTLLRQYGFDEPKTPQEYGGFFTGEVSADELKERLDTYRGIQRSGRPVKEAFYIYAGMKLTDDDLYSALIEPERWKQMQSEYNVRVASQPLNYETWVQRATEVGLQRVVESLEALENEGIVTGSAIERIRGVNPAFARQMVDVLYTGGDPGGTEYMSNLDELMASFEEAMIGGAAYSAGLGLPSKERIAELRAAGVQRAQAIQKYTEFGSRKQRIDAAVRRHGGGEFGRYEFEGSEFLGDAGSRDLLEQSLRQEDSLGKGGGGVASRLSEFGPVASGFDPIRS